MKLDFSFFRLIHNCLCQRMFRSLLKRSGEIKNFRLVVIVKRDNIGQSRPPFRKSASFISTPLLPALPEETIMAIGVARPKAHGQAMIKTATKFISAKVKAGTGPKKNQKKKVKKAMINTAGTK